MIQAKTIFCRYFGLFILFFTLTGCASLDLENGTWADADDRETETEIDTDKTTPTGNDDVQFETSAIGPLSGEELESSALNKTSPEKDELLLYAASAYIDNARTDKALQILNSVNTSQLPEHFSLRQQTLFAAINIKENDLDEAQSIIESLMQSNNSDPIFSNWLLLAQSSLHQQQGNFLEALVLLTTQDQSNAVENINIAQNIWQLISNQSLEKLNQSRREASAPLELGWIELGIIAKKQELTPPAIWQQSLSLWKNAYIDHPAISIHQQLSNTISTELLDSDDQTSTRIALLLPLSSAYEEIANKVKDGFLAAGSENNHQISVYDIGSGASQIVSQYQRAVQNGAQIIVGPLGKSAATELASQNIITKPTLLLGNVYDSPEIVFSPNTFTFSLDPESEAQSIAKHAYVRGNNTAAILYPDSSRGKRLNRAFAKEWSRLGGSLTAAIAFDNDLYEAEPHVELLYSASRRPDIIFLATNSQQGRLLGRVLNERFPGTVLFATSSIYSGNSDPTRDFVLNNVIFTDMPWMIDGFSNAQFRKQQLLNGNLKSPTSLDRYYAFGVDAYALAAKFHRFMNQPGASITGVTGNIQLLGNHFKLTQPLVQFFEGSPIPAN